MKFNFDSIVQGAALLLMGLLSLSFLALAEVNQIEFGVTSAGGTGCQKGQGTKIQTSESQIELALEMKAQSTNALTRLACTVAVPVKIPKQKKLVVKPEYFEGEGKIDEKGMGQASVSFYFSGSAGTSLKHDLSGPNSKSFKVTFPPTTQLQSSCGSDTILNIQASAYVSKSGLLQVHSARAQLSLEDCK